MGRPKGAKNKPKGAPKRPLRGRDLNKLGRGAVPNRAQIQAVTLKEGIMRAYEKLGGWQGLAAWGLINPDDFYTKVLMKVLPLEVDLRKTEPVIVEIGLHEKQAAAPLVLDNDTGLEIVPENAGLYPDYPGVVSRD